ncbi:peptidoglycan DD-metalloendopeptidase family protein [[Mycobacterium] nativiensis]|uniref:Peptidoglycan DD-metalloendopeptidase family protein n=1 Tax=[Mycobacterium] nativiensis TaxID=2855503 RepID=A0ABU5XVW1_9MYCO|nr:peptidoglycan DD-metalloendopeptidase family protein [Mycolicibacter sp. MYC340]MEB3031136.1 peptidoglycan DD-metalloendopeptidase family protein [Mycolicibacter sp. MYC340]
MTNANIAVSVEPAQQGRMTCLPMAPNAPGADPQNQISLVVSLTNKETSAVHVASMVLIPAGASAPAKTYTLGFDIAAGGTQVWAGATSDDYVFGSPLPASVELALTVDGFSDPTVVSFPLAWHVNPTPQGSYRFWGDPAELASAEYWVGQGATHETGTAGTQIFAYDVGVEAWSGSGWTALLPGTDGTSNEQYRCFGKSIHAVADGVVLAFRNDFPLNPTPGTVADDVKALIQQVGDGNGNFFCVDGGGETVLYAHMQPGSLNPALLSKGAAVTQGQFLGKLGNAGNAYGPHLHIHANATNTGPQYWVGPPRPFLMHGGQVLGQDRLAAQKLFGPWVNLGGRGWPPQRSMVWPVDNSWESLGGQLTSGPGVCSWGPGRLDAFAVGTDSALWHRYWDGHTWHNWESLGGQLTSDPAAAAWAQGRCDVVARGTDNALWHKWWDGNVWHNWESLGGQLTSGPGVCSWGPGRLDVFARGTDSALWHKWWDGHTWHNWESLGGQLTSDPAAAAWAQGRCDVVVRGTDNALWHKWWDGSTWHNWESLGGQITASPTLATRGANRLDAFVRGTDNSLYQRIWNGNSWSSWQALGGALGSRPAAVAWSSTRVDVFATGDDRTLRHTWWDGNWHP